MFHLVARDIVPLFGSRAHNNTPSPSLRVRQPRAGGGPANPGSLGSVLVGLDRDVCTYICRNDIRERVRRFVYEALLRICSRADVSTVIINAHSQGSVVAYDVLRQLPPFAVSKVKILVTAGSPLRKYADLYTWGTDTSGFGPLTWHNFWDARDPVADPLAQAKEWHTGDRLAPKPYPSLFFHTDLVSGVQKAVDITDVQVDNVAHVEGGGLVAHNYWDNQSEFVQPLTGYLKSLVGVA